MLWKLFVLAVLAGVGVAIWRLWQKIETVEVTSPVDRVYVYRRKVTRAGRFGSHIGARTEPITGHGHTKDGQSHLLLGKHRFPYPVKVVRCSAGQHPLNFWADDNVDWKKAGGPATQGPIEVTTRDGISGTLELRVSYQVNDTMEDLVNFSKPEMLAERASADTLVVVRDYVNSRGYVELLTSGREALHAAIWEELSTKLMARRLRLRDVWIGKFEVNDDLMHAWQANAVAKREAETTMVQAQSRAIAYRTIAEAVDPRLIELIRAERSGASPFASWPASQPGTAFPALGDGSGGSGNTPG